MRRFRWALLKIYGNVWLAKKTTRRVKMASIIDHLFDGEIDERNRVCKPKDLSKDREFVAYEKYKGMLTEQQQEMFEKFLEEQAVQEEVKLKSMYGRAFKIGLLIGLETANFNPED